MPLPISLTTPLPDGHLLLSAMTHSAGLSTLGDTQLDLVSPRADLKAEDLLGKPITIGLNLRSEEQRYFHGYVTRFGIGAHRGRHFGYHLTLSPWLWFLSRTADCRIFQELSVPDIVKKVLEDHAVANFEFRLFRSYRKWVYCVQYRETDFNFIARLLEHEGIYWYFEHRQSEHKLVIVDSQSAHDPAPHCPSLPYVEEGTPATPDTECVSDWSFAREVRSGKVVLTSYDFERPSTALEVKSSSSRPHALSDYEMFDFQGDYAQSADGSQWAEDRVQELQTSFESLHGSSNAQGIEVGRLLTLARHPRPDQNIEYLVTALTLRAEMHWYESGEPAGEFRCDFSAIPSSQQFRPLRRTPKPFVQGPQTAVVVGPAGEEIFTDKYGRVKLQFHWDRYGRKNEKSSCWVRVAHPWAGKNFGMVDIPRIGQEVVVDFLEGDPDQPLITGRVYNAEQMPPWDLPANATQSGILTRSSKGGGYGNANAIRFEDKAGSEQLWIHAEKNQDIEVEKDETHWVGQDRKKTIDRDETTQVKRDRTETVDRHETIVIHGHRTETVDQDERITIHQNRIEHVAHDEIVTIGNDHTETIRGSMSAMVNKTKSETVMLNSSETVGIAKELTVGGLYQVTVGAAHNTTVGAAHALEVAGASAEMIGGSKTLAVAGGHSETVGGKQAITVNSDRSLRVNGKSEQTIQGAHTFKAKKIAITAEDELIITVGSAKLVMKKDGSILLDGKDVATKASGKVDVKASGDIVLKGSNIKEN